MISPPPRLPVMQMSSSSSILSAPPLCFCAHNPTHPIWPCPFSGCDKPSSTPASGDNNGPPAAAQPPSNVAGKDSGDPHFLHVEFVVQCWACRAPQGPILSRNRLPLLPTGLLSPLLPCCCRSSLRSLGLLPVDDKSASTPSSGDNNGPPAAAQPPSNVAGKDGGDLQSGAVGSGHAAAPNAGIGAVLKQGWEDLKHGGAKAPHATSTGVSWHVTAPGTLGAGSQGLQSSASWLHCSSQQHVHYCSQQQGGGDCYCRSL